MRILIVTPKYYPDTFPINLIAEGFVKRGHQVDVLTSVPFRKGKYIDEYNKEVSKEHGVNVYRIKSYIRTNTRKSLSRNYLSLYKEFKRWIKKCKKDYDVVYSYSVSPVVTLVAGNIYKKKHHVPHVAHVLDLWPESVVDAGYTSKGSLLYRILFRWSKKLYQGVDTLLIGSNSFKDYLVNTIKVDESKIKYIPQPGLVSEDNKGANPFDTKKTNILYCGNISTLQLVDYIVPAMQKINNPDIIFNIVGTGSYLDELKKEIKDKKIENVVYHGYFYYQSSSLYIKNADCLFVPLKNKGTTGKTIPNKLISSLYYSKPIIGMITGEAEEILKENGNIIAEESVDGLVEAINKFMKMDNKTKGSISKKNRQYYDDHFSFDNILNNLLSSLSSK